MRQFVAIERVRELSKVNAAVTLSWVFAAWATIAGVVVLNEMYGNWFTTIIAVGIIANQMHGLLIQMHDASHFRLAKNRLLNDVVGELLCAWPMFFRMAGYRENHRRHHMYSNQPGLDPDFRDARYPKSREQAIRMLLGDLVGLGTVQQLGEVKRMHTAKAPTSIRVARLAYYALIVAIIAKTNAWLLVATYWLLPAFTWLKVILRLRAFADHAGVHTNEAPFDTRTVIPTVFDRIFLAPRNCSYHFGHHTYESVPFYNLKKLHKELMKNETVAANIRITRGFHRLLSELPSEKAILVEAPATSV